MLVNGSFVPGSRPLGSRECFIGLSPFSKATLIEILIVFGTLRASRYSEKETMSGTMDLRKK